MINNPKSDPKKKKKKRQSLKFIKKIKVMSKKLLLVKKKKNQLTRQSINKSDSLHSFLPILERKFSGKSRKKTIGLRPFFSLSPSQVPTKHPSKSFLSLFYLSLFSLFFFFSILPKIHSTKHTLKK